MRPLRIAHDVNPSQSEWPRIVGVDVGGTFTDFAAVDHRSGEIAVRKLATTPNDPAIAVLEGLSDLDPECVAAVAHGTTVATNALLERTGARVAYVTTAGFGDVLRLGRGDRAALYSLAPADRPTLVRAADVHEVAERLGPDGGVVVELTALEARRVAEAVAASAAEAIAICCLHAYASDRHERALAAAIESALAELGRTDVPVSCSVDVLPEMREYERASTTVVNAYLTPPVRGYLARLRSETRPRPLTIMGSHGGTLLPGSAVRTPVTTLLSGPAAGVAGALHVGGRVGARRILTFDMGGTSTDVAVCDGSLPVVARSSVDGFPIGREMIDIHTVGAGGGSIVRADEVGALRIGPESAGADPGPACYRRGGVLPTITDAHAVLGRLPHGMRLGGADGALQVDAGAAERAIASVADRIGLGLEETARIALRVAESVMERALRSVTIERGVDPAELALVAFGGAGPLHACALAETLGIRRIILPQAPGALSALGLLVTPRSSSAARTVLRRGAGGPAPFDRVFAQLDSTVLAELFDDPATAARRPADSTGAVLRHEADLRYAGQAWEITVPWHAGEPLVTVAARFEEEHDRRHGFRSVGTAVEVVTLRSHAAVRPPADLPIAAFAAASRSVPDRTSVVDDQGHHIECPIVRRADLGHGQALIGPAIIAQDDTTTWLSAGWRAHRLPSFDIVLERASA